MDYFTVVDVLETLPYLVTEARKQRGLSYRDAAKEADLSFVTMRNVEQGHYVHVHTAIKLFRWLAYCEGERG